MSLDTAFSRTRRSLEFARHMPASKLARRVELSLRRRLFDRFGGRAPDAPRLERQNAPPQPIFAARKNKAPEVIEDGRLRLSFLGRSVDMVVGKIDWSAPGRGPANQLWRMNLHYMEYLEGVDDALWTRLVTDWIDRNGDCYPGAWRDSWNSYALSLRVVVWLQELVRRDGRLPEALVAMVEGSAARQLRFLEDNLETDLGGNHLIKNIKALIWAGTYFQGAVARRWRERGIALLRRELAEQILDDGVHYERSTSYHAQVFADLLECRAALGTDPFGGTMDDALARMAQATIDLTHPDGGVALFNDAGLTMAYAPDVCLGAYLALGFVPPTARSHFAFSEAGYFGMRSGETYFVSDCGAIAPDDLPAHGHGDVLSFEWSVGGQRIIVDQGVFEYIDGERRAASRSATYHNTLCLEGADQADFFGSFRCGRRPCAELIAFQKTETGIVVDGCHDGFTSLPGRPVHRRRFEVSETHIEIDDRLDGLRDRPGKISMLLHPHVTVRVMPDGVRLVSGADEILVTSSVPLRTEKAVWWPDMGRELITARIVGDLQEDVRSVKTRLQNCTSKQVDEVGIETSTTRMREKR